MGNCKQTTNVLVRLDHDDCTQTELPRYKLGNGWKYHRAKQSPLGHCEQRLGHSGFMLGLGGEK